MMTPGLNFTASDGYAAPFLRGVGSNNSGPGVESPVATYVDGVYYSSLSSTVFSLNDIDSVDVLKGPQGTLFGRNATGGVIQINTRDPIPQFGLDVQAGFGNYNTASTKAYLTGGVADGISANLAFAYDRQGDGYGRNQYNGADVNRTQDDLGFRTKWLIEANEDTRITVSADYSRMISSIGSAFRPVEGTLPLLGPAFIGGFQDINSNTQPSVDDAQGGVSAHIDYDLHLFKIVSITAYRDEHFEATLDGDAGPVNGETAQVNTFNSQLSQEVQLISPNEAPIRWVSGFYFLKSTGHYDPAAL
jgi:iron complex outermembrane recepter protein